MKPGLINRSLLITLLLRVLVLAYAVVLAGRGGYYPFGLLLIPLVAWEVYRIMKPAPQRSPSRQFTEPGAHRVVLQVSGGKRIEVIREVRRTTGRALPDAKRLVDDAPVVVAEGLSETSAELVADRLRAAGAKALAAPIGEM